ncbi:MAG: 1-acyl-sn-glycerol-3-phosphate acyltransferase [Actinobacteria bacterium]|nr:1-acyl-sn-glycerol-3-phosphate acyltransferase [Actinomycetota bacterium]MCI0679679.1 1-acyl-sn-glycerol-3-phosphate acyltransferase [Actinomycetota bacterium]
MAQGDLEAPPGLEAVYLVDAATELESRILLRWVRRATRRQSVVVRIDSSRRRGGGDHAALHARLVPGSGDYLVPLRVVWMAPVRRGRRSVDWRDVFKPGDPRDPRGLRAHWIRFFHPSRVVPVAGQGASVADLLEAHAAGDEIDGLVPFVTRRAWRALDVCERRLLGNRYKVPRFVPETILSRRSFHESIEGYAAAVGVDPVTARERAARYLKEIAATHSPYVIDIIANVIHTLYRRGYGAIRYHEEQVAAVAELGEANPVVFLPSHRSNLDRLSLQFLLWENDLPPNHTAGGINLDFFPVGPLMRRTGVFFIRRSFRDNELYKLVLRAYIDFLIEKRFPLEWYMEGGRSRSGRLLPPRFGLLHYVVDSLRRGKADDVMLIPVSIVYDQIQDVPDYTREALGMAKERESLRWLVRSWRSLQRRYGDIHIRFAEPVSVATITGDIGGVDEPAIALQKTAFEVMRRIAGVTPVTPTALVSIALLAARGKAKTAGELADGCATLSRFLTARGIEMTEPADLSDPDVVRVILARLADHGAVSSHEALGRTVHWLEETQMIQLSYYRNVVLHYFLPRAIAEIALRQGPGSFDEAAVGLQALRDLLKFEFFFAERDQFVSEVSADISIDVPGWERLLDTAGADEVLAKMGDPLAYWAILPILDAYQVVGDELEALHGDFDEKRFLKACLARARMYRIEERLISGESASQVMFKSALALASNRGLLEGGPTEARLGFAFEVRRVRQSAAFGL